METIENSQTATSNGAGGAARRQTRLGHWKHLCAVSACTLLVALSGQASAWTLGPPPYPELELDPSEFPGGVLPLELTLFSGFYRTPPVDDTTVYALGVPEDFPPYLRNLDLDVEVRGHARSANGMTHVVAKTDARTEDDLLQIRQTIGAALIDNGWKVLTPRADALFLEGALLCHDTEGSMMVSFYGWGPGELPDSEHWIGLILSISPYADEEAPYISCGEERRLFPLRQPLDAFMQPLRSPARGLLELPEGATYDSWVGWDHGNTVLNAGYHSTHSLYQSLFNQLRDQGWSEIDREYDDLGYEGRWFRKVALPAELQIDGRKESELNLSLQLRPLGDGRHDFQLRVEADIYTHSRVRVMDCYVQVMPCLDYPINNDATVLIPPSY